MTSIGTVVNNNIQAGVNKDIQGPETPARWVKCRPQSEAQQQSVSHNDGMDCSLPADDLLQGHREIQAAAFALLFEHDRAATVESIATRAGRSHDETSTALAEIEARGMLRRDDQGDIVGIGGLTIVPTQHKITIGATTRWTWCALDAVGIIGALGHSGRFTTTVPDSDQPVTIEFNADTTPDTSAVVFIAEGFADGPVADNWCPTVNLFPSAAAANAWAAESGLAGNPISITELIPDATEMWLPLVTMI